MANYYGRGIAGNLVEKFNVEPFVSKSSSSQLGSHKSHLAVFMRHSRPVVTDILTAAGLNQGRWVLYYVDHSRGRGTTPRASVVRAEPRVGENGAVVLRLKPAGNDSAHVVRAMLPKRLPWTADEVAYKIANAVSPAERQRVVTRDQPFRAPVSDDDVFLAVVAVQESRPQWETFTDHNAFVDDVVARAGKELGRPYWEDVIAAAVDRGLLEREGAIYKPTPYGVEFVGDDEEAAPAAPPAPPADAVITQALALAPEGQGLVPPAPADGDERYALGNLLPMLQHAATIQKLGSEKSVAAASVDLARQDLAKLKEAAASAEEALRVAQERVAAARRAVADGEAEVQNRIEKIKAIDRQADEANKKNMGTLNNILDALTKLTKGNT